MDPFHVDDLFSMKRLAELQGRAGRKDVVFSVAQAMKDGDCYRTRLWHVDVEAGSKPRPLTSDAFEASSPALDPDARAVAFLSTRLGESAQVHVLPLDGGEARQLTRSERTLESIEQWSADGRRLLAIARVAHAEDSHDDTGAQDRPLVVNFLPWKLDGSGPRVGFRNVLLAIDAESGEERVLVEGDFDVMEARWSPDGSRLAFVRGREGLQRHRLDLWLADADGGNARQATHELASIGGLSWSPDGRRLVFGASDIEGDSITLPWRFDVDDGALHRLDDDLQLEGSTLAWHPDGRRFATIAARRGLQEVLVVDADDGSARRLDSGLQHATALCAAGDHLVFVVARMDRPDELCTVPWGCSDDSAGNAGGEGDDTADLLSNFNAWIERRPVPRAEKRGFQVPDGDGGTEEAEAWLLQPASGDGPFPLLVDFHGGPQSHVLIDFASHVYWYPLLSQGWAVLAPNMVGSGSYGTGFARRLRGRWGELDLPQVLAMIDALQAEGIASERLACTGKSYGGYLAAWAIGQTPRFDAAVVSAPISDIESHTGTSDTGYYVGPYSMQGEIDEVRERYHRLSPIEYCNAISTSTLILQGDEDQRCPLGQAEQLYANLVRCAEMPARMVVYPGGGHTLASNGKPSHRVDYHTRLVDWIHGER